MFNVDFLENEIVAFDQHLTVVLRDDMCDVAKISHEDLVCQQHYLVNVDMVADGKTNNF